VCPAREDLVIEIGPGKGALTAKLLERAGRVVAIEVDVGLVEHLRARFPTPHLELVHADVMAADLAQWGRAPVCGNLPYYITSPILDKVVRLCPPRAVFLVQKEVAQRLTARPGTREYGYLTVQTQVFAFSKVLFHVKASAFRPPPKVESSVVLLEPHPGFAAADREAFLEFAGRCFHQKRKTLRNNLVAYYPKDLVDAQPEAGMRAEQLSLEQLIALWERLTAAVHARPV